MTHSLDARRAALQPLMYADETQLAKELLQRVSLPGDKRANIVEEARKIVARARERKSERGLLEIFLQEFGLSTDEGIALLSLAEALLRVPDSATADNLIAEKINSGGWAQHQGQSESTLVNVATRALVLTSGVVEL
ncbi:MAG TPA: hypothetical protein VNQ81_02750, partial [Povalibacter sp.]|nr:hypothetical protein [Povalibacter sp.]